MTFRSVVYFHGPKSAWNKQMHEDEVIASYQSPLRWLVRWQARNTHKGLDPTRCGYAVMNETEVLEHVEAL